jgi:hypothetical protein
LTLLVIRVLNLQASLLPHNKQPYPMEAAEEAAAEVEEDLQQTQPLQAYLLV